MFDTILDDDAFIKEVKEEQDCDKKYEKRKKKVNYDLKITIRVNAEEYEKVKKKAKALNISTNSYIRICMNTTHIKYNKKAKERIELLKKQKIDAIRKEKERQKAEEQEALEYFKSKEK